LETQKIPAQILGPKPAGLMLVRFSPVFTVRVFFIPQGGRLLAKLNWGAKDFLVGTSGASLIFFNFGLQIFLKKVVFYLGLGKFKA